MCGLCVCQFFLQVRKACFVYSSVYDMMTSANEVLPQIVILLAELLKTL